MPPPETGEIEDSERVLVLAPRGRDAPLTCELLRGHGLLGEICADVEDLCRRIDEGAGAALVAEEALTPHAAARLARTLGQEPPWSDFPVLVLGTGTRVQALEAAGGLPALGNVTFLDRPVGVRTMLSAVDAALRARRRQYEGKRAIRSRDEFLAMLGHELRTPLGAIRLAVELLNASEGAPEDGGPGARHRAVIERQSRHLARLVDDLLDVARVTTGKVRLRPAPLDLSQVLGSAFDLFEPRARAAGVDLALSAPRPLPVSGDPGRLEQVFANLLTNAIKYTPRGGSVRVEASADGDSALVRVVDSGIGIERRMLGRVFDLFAQADQGLERTDGGMGLGLTLVRSLVRLHGGEIAAKSAGVGQGSEFSVRLPLLRGPAEAARRPSAAPSEASASRTEEAPEGRGRRLRVVVVEDSEDIRAMLEELLESAGHEVRVAGDGPEGLERIVSERPDVAFVDVGLPVFDGHEVARRVRAEGLRDVVLVALTGYGQREDRARTREAGFDVHLTKPVGGDELLAALRAVRTRL